jgi:hypothetical protein
VVVSYSKVETVYTYKTSLGTNNYHYDIVVDSNGKLSFRNVRGPKGLIADSRTALPQEVIKDMQDAMSIVASYQSSISLYTGQIIFEGDMYKDVPLPDGTVASSNYHVAFSTPDGVSLNSEDLTVTGFTAVAPFEYGSEEEPIEVDFSILAPVLPTTEYSSSVTFTSVTGSTQNITFTNALNTSKYHVILNPRDFFSAYVSNKSKTGFTLNLSYSVPVGENAVIDYDIVL